MVVVLMQLFVTLPLQDLLLLVDDVVLRLVELVQGRAERIGLHKALGVLVVANSVVNRQLVHVDAALVLQVGQFVFVDAAHSEAVVSDLLLVVCISDRTTVHANLLA